MGQAKQRGTYQQRQAQGIQRKAEEHKRRLEKREKEKVEQMQRDFDEVAKMPPDEQQRRKSRRLMLASAASIALTCSVSHGDTGISVFGNDK